jgi:hypothetical protein
LGSAAIKDINFNNKFHFQYIAAAAEIMEPHISICARGEKSECFVNVCSVRQCVLLRDNAVRCSLLVAHRSTICFVFYQEKTPQLLKELVIDPRQPMILLKMESCLHSSMMITSAT